MKNALLKFSLVTLVAILALNLFLQVDTRETSNLSLSTLLETASADEEWVDGYKQEEYHCDSGEPNCCAASWIRCEPVVGYHCNVSSQHICECYCWW